MSGVKQKCAAHNGRVWRMKACDTPSNISSVSVSLCRVNKKSAPKLKIVMRMKIAKITTNYQRQDSFYSLKVRIIREFLVILLENDFKFQAILRTFICCYRMFLVHPIQK